MSFDSKVQELFQKISQANGTAISRVATAVFSAVESGGIVHVFGTGHSAILTIEAFHRAGGLIPVNPIIHDFLTPLVSPKISGRLERLEGVAPILFSRAGIKPGDIVFIASNSGINAAAIEMAIECKKVGVMTVAFTSLSHSKNAISRHSSKKRLFELVDQVLDNGCPQGDGLLMFDEVQVGAGSSLANIYLYNSILEKICEEFRNKGQKLPIYKSANLPGSDAENEIAEKKYRSRISLL